MQRRVFFVVILAALIALAACSPAREMGMTATMPVGRGYADEQEIYFIHTEASDAELAQLLTDMMDSPVLHVPSLAEIPAQALANVYVFTNGVEGTGPLGYAPDVFDLPPGTEGYTPLRRLNLVTWADPAGGRELKAASEVLEAEASGELSIEQPGVVINMPFVVWETGKR